MKSKTIKEKLIALLEKKGLNNRGQTGGGTVGLVIGVIATVGVGALFLIFLLYAIGVINLSSLFPQTGQTSLAGNVSQAAVNNVTVTVANFTAGLPIVGTIAAVLILIAIIVILFVYLSRMRESAGGGSSI